MKTAIGLDLGGTHLTAGLVSDAGEVLSLRQANTPGDGAAALALVTDLVRELYAVSAGKASGGRSDPKSRPAISLPADCPLPIGIGVSFGGPVDYDAQTIVRSHHVAGWEPGLRLADHFARTFNTIAILENDANCGGLGEAAYGAARGYASMLYVNIGTGIGGAVLFSGRVHHGAHSTAGEIGHCVVQPGGPLCTCDKHGCLEALSSGSAIAREGRLAGLGEAITGREVGDRALAGDPTAGKVICQAGEWLGLALGNATNLVDPDIIVLGGGVPELGEPYLGPARRVFSATAMPAAVDTPIVAAALGYNAGVIGAAALVMKEAVMQSMPPSPGGSLEPRGR